MAAGTTDTALSQPLAAPSCRLLRNIYLLYLGPYLPTYLGKFQSYFFLYIHHVRHQLPVHDATYISIHVRHTVTAQDPPYATRLDQWTLRRGYGGTKSRQG